MMCLRFVILSLCLMGTACASDSVIAIQPLGQKLPDADVAMVREGLTQVFGVTVVILPRVPLPKNAYFAPRKRYRADDILSFSQDQETEECISDFGTDGRRYFHYEDSVYDWGILGLATLDGVSCVVSSFRTKRSRSTLHARERLSKVAVHEIGHTMGLEHCPNSGCLMEDAKGSVVTTEREYELCRRCRSSLKTSGYQLPNHPKLPWRSIKREIDSTTRIGFGYIRLVTLMRQDDGGHKRLWCGLA